MTKSDFIDYINANNRVNLNSSNTSFSSINKSRNVWWFTIPVSKFSEDVHLLLSGENNAYWILLPRDFAVAVLFRIRQDRNAADIEISADKNYMYLKDIKSGSTGFDFGPFIKEKFTF